MTDQPQQKFVKFSQGNLPRVTLQETLALANSLRDNFAAKSATPIDLAKSLNRSPSSSDWRYVTGAAVAYGLTSGGYNATSISLTELGRKIVRPEGEGEDKTALVQTALKPQILKDFYTRYDKNKFPRDEIAKNVLISMGVPDVRANEALKIVKENGQFTGILIDVKGELYIQLSGAATRVEDQASNASKQEQLHDQPQETEMLVAPDVIEGMPKPEEQKKAIFIAHGKDTKSLEELKKILNGFGLPYEVAVDEPHAGRPISQKVRDLMRKCGSAIFVFSKGGEKVDDQQIAIPNLNMVYELGAASVLYGEKIIIFKEDGIAFPTDFSDLGYISFLSENIQAKAMDLLHELVRMGFVKITPAT